MCAKAKGLKELIGLRILVRNGLGPIEEVVPLEVSPDHNYVKLKYCESGRKEWKDTNDITILSILTQEKEGD